MIVGIVALFSVLFFGGAQEYFFIEKLEKGIKKYVFEKDRSKEILADLKLTKSMIKTFNKERKAKLSDFHSMNLDRSISREVLVDFFEERVEERQVFQEKMIEKRLMVVSKIKDGEWKEIISLSYESVQKKMEKVEKKGSSDPLEAVIKTINSRMADQNNQAKAVSIVQDFNKEYTGLLKQVNAVNTIESDLLSNKNTSAAQFQKLANDMNQLRKTAYESLIDLHFDLKEITNETEWVKVMKSVNKVIS
jgi:hypothetical protein